MAHKNVSDVFKVHIESCLFGISDVQYSDCSRNLTAYSEDIIPAL